MDRASASRSSPRPPEAGRGPRTLLSMPVHTRSVRVVNQTRGTPVCSARIADTSRTRLFGLLGERGLAPGTGLLIRPSSGVHTWGMRFPIDIVALDANRRILGLWRGVGPWKLRGLGLKTRSVLELAAGAIDCSRSEVGDVLAFAPSPSCTALDENG